MSSVVIPQAGAQNFVRLLLRFDINRGVNGETTLRHASGVFILKLLSDLFDGVIKSARFRLRLVIGSIGKLDWFCFGRVHFRMSRETILGH